MVEADQPGTSPDYDPTLAAIAMRSSPQSSRSQPRDSPSPGCDVAKPDDDAVATTPDSAWDKLLRQVADQWPLDRWGDLGVVVGCSGGADSVALVAALAALRERGRSCAAAPPRGFLVVAHFHHRLRGSDADADQTLTEDLAQRLGLKWMAGRAERPQSDEASMRAERMQFLIDTAQATGSRYIALAHSADDNVETVLHHLMRGTGPAGLSGIGSPRSISHDLVLIRPLLHTRRDLIRSALLDRGIAWREDASNLDSAYRRNWIRHELIPLIQTQYPHAIDAIERAIEGQRQWREIIDRMASRWLDDHLISENPLVVRRDADQDPAVLVAAFQQLWTRRGWPRGEMTQSHWLRLADTVASDGPQRYHLPSGLDVLAQNDEVKLNRSDET